ncbi:MAG: biotin--[acetyl-CoA-carboxylase] ligase [Candidatus Marinimicrobia bacterium]|nr:biotin--[acetyl-CoA-carboxylase] ligase [Candidatus Neomarinimicrobiota bacterium]
MLFTNLVQANLKTRILGQQIEYYTRLKSTNAESWKIIDKGAQSGALIVTDNQFNGRGKADRKWVASANKSLTFSILLFMDLDASISGWLPILTGVAVQKALLQFDLSVKLKWPNDLILDGRKVGGILCESKIKKTHLNQVVIGVGLNVNETLDDFDPLLQSTATSFHIVTEKLYQRERVLAEILNELEKLIEGLPDNTSNVQSQWEIACNHMNKEVQFHCGKKIVKGIFKSLGESGSAVLNINGKESEYFSGEIA